SSGMASDGKIFFCPSYPGNSPLGADAYSSGAPTPGPLMTIGTGPAVRGSYTYNPVITDTNTATVNTIRKFRKVSNVTGRRTFIMDYLDIGMSDPKLCAHIRSKGWNISFTDGSVAFSHPDPVTYASILAWGSSVQTAAMNLTLPTLEDAAR